MKLKSKVQQFLKRGAVLLGVVALLLAGCYLFSPAFVRSTPSVPQPSPQSEIVPTESFQLLLVNQAPPSREQQQELQKQLQQLSPDIRSIMERGVLRVAVRKKDNPPFFESSRNGQLTGLDIDLAKAIARYLGVDVQFDRSASTFNDVVDRVAQGQADIAVSKLSRTLNRTRRVQFSNPYVQMRQGLLANRMLLSQQLDQQSSNESLEALSMLHGKIGAVKGSSYVGFVGQVFPNASLVEYPDWDRLVQAVLRGEVLAACRDELEIKKVLLTQPEANLYLQSLVVDSPNQDKIAVALPWKSAQLRSFINQYLEESNLDLTADTLLNFSQKQR